MIPVYEYLIKGSLEGDRACQYEIYKKLSPKLMSLCLRYARSRFEAEDCLQDSFIKIFESLKSYSGNGSFEGWAKKITVNILINYLRKEKNSRDQISLENIDFEYKNVNHGQSKMEYDELLNTIEMLPYILKIVFNLHVIEGYSHKEIGKIMEVTETSSRIYLFRAKEQLMKIHKSQNYV